MNSCEHEDEEVKLELPLLRRVSSQMEVAAYSRVSALVLAVK